MKIAIIALSLAAILVVGLVVALGRRGEPNPAPHAATVMPIASPTLGGSEFNPLQAEEVKDAIHRALRTGQTQRWQARGLSGYAVPSQARGANGCRAVRYTIDQRPDVPYQSITACE